MTQAVPVLRLDDTSSRCLQGRYRLVSELGRGGMSVVWRARDELLGRDVAIKLFASHAEGQELAQQHAEARLLASFTHHGLVTLLDAGVDLTDEQAPRVFLVMELLLGADLKQRIDADGPLTARQVAFLGHDLGEALEYVHDRGVVHRDVKPANVVLSDHAQTRRLHGKLIDFGVATLRDLREEGEFTTGTAAYLSPEQASGEPIGPAADIYSLGLVLLEALTGRTEFPGAVVPSAMARLQRDPVVPDSVPTDLAACIRAMTAKRPEERPTAAEVILAMRQFAVDDIGKRRGVSGPSVDARVIPEDEAERMAAVRRYDILDTPPDGAFDRITSIAARVFDAPVAIVSIVDNDRIWFKSHHGIDATEIGRDPGLCASAILQRDVWLVDDAGTDPRTLANPLVNGEMGVRFYAGVPLATADGHNLGTLCVLDTRPKRPSSGQLATLEELAQLVMHELELRLAARRAVLSRA